MNFLAIPVELWEKCLGSKYPMFTLVNKQIFDTFIPKVSQISVSYSHVYGRAKNCENLQLRLRRKVKSGVVLKVRGQFYKKCHDPSLAREEGISRIYTFDPPVRVSTVTVGTEGKWCAHPHVNVKPGLMKSEKSDLNTFLYWIIDKK